MAFVRQTKLHSVLTKRQLSSEQHQRRTRRTEGQKDRRTEGQKDRRTARAPHLSPSLPTDVPLPPADTSAANPLPTASSLSLPLRNPPRTSPPPNTPLTTPLEPSSSLLLALPRSPTGAHHTTPNLSAGAPCGSTPPHSPLAKTPPPRSLNPTTPWTSRRMNHSETAPASDLTRPRCHRPR